MSQLCDAPRFSQPDSPRGLTADERKDVENTERAERMEDAIRAFLVQQMTIERVGSWDEPDFDEFHEEFSNIVDNTNVFSDAYKLCVEEREANRARVAPAD